MLQSGARCIQAHGSLHSTLKTHTRLSPLSALSAMRTCGQLLYAAGTLTLLPGCTLLLDQFTARWYATGIWFLVAATTLVTLAAIADLVQAVRGSRTPAPPPDPSAAAALEQRLLEAPLPLTGMVDHPMATCPHCAVPMAMARRASPRPTERCLRCDGLLEWPPSDRAAASGSGRGSQLKDTTAHDRGASALDSPSTCRHLFVPYLMLQGGVCFIAGSVLYLPGATSFPAAGTWVFRTGTCSYLLGSSTSWLALVRSPGGLAGNGKAAVGVGCFIVGALLYFVGGVLSEVSLPGFAETWVAGSVFFAAGALAFVA